jgi:hypothetical protein
MKPPPKKTLKKPMTDIALLNSYKMNFIRGFTFIVLSLLVYGVVAFLLQRFYNPDTSLAIEYAKKVIVNYSP